MNTKKTRTVICDLEIETVKKDIKNIHVGVYPPNGRVRVAAPLKTTDEAIKLLVISKMPWIKKQQLKFEGQERQTKREYVSGESHYFFGNRYRLNVMQTDSKPKIEIKRKTRINMYVKPHASLEEKERLMDSFYRSELKKQIPDLVSKWEKITGLNIKEVKIKKMKTKWGTCIPKFQRIWLNLELAKKPPRCLEYVIVHELTHLKEKHHNEHFEILLKSYMPQWDQCKQELNNGIIGYSEWEKT
ncbi:MAG: SprT family zinc-dependent metalloprotease [Candidatus Bathyarchaeia archaeon]|jgi:predicted metal-dependent hydrolase